MNSILTLVLILAAAPLGIFLLHIVTHRLLLLLKGQVSGHASALFTLLAGNLIIVCLAWYFSISHWLNAPLSLISGLIYTLIVFNGLGILYFDILNISETSLHMHILLEIVWANGLSASALREKYSAQNMVKTRLERLTDLGQIQLNNNRYYVGNRTVLYLSKALTVWRAILGLPLEPDMPAVNPEAKLPRPIERKVKEVQ